MKRYLLITLILASMLSCISPTVVALKTGKGFHESTAAGSIDIYTAVPTEKYEELGTISASNFDISDIGKMHNALRDKASTLGANAVIITNQGQVQRGVLLLRWAEGTAIKWIK